MCDYFNNVISVNSFLSNLRAREENDKDKGTTKLYTYSQANQEAIENLYFSDGRVVLYAIPLHYLRIQDGVDEKTSSPMLVGFVTTERGIVNAFAENFEKIKKLSVEFTKSGDYLNQKS